MANIRINDLPADAAPNAGDVVAIDGTTTRKATLTDAVNAGRPFASQAEAESGTSPTKAMSPLTTAQAIAALGGTAFAPSAAGIPAGGAVDQVLGKTGSGDFAVSWRNAGAGDMIGINNLADVADAATSLSNLGGLTSALAASTYLTQVAAAATYQPIGSYQPQASNLTSWAAVTRAAGYDAFATGPTSANLKALMTDETGSGALVFATSPTLVTPALGTPTALVLTNATGLTEAGVVSTTTDALRITIGNLAYPARYGTYDPTGVADSTTALQAAASGKKYVEVGEGTFKISSAINLVSGSKIIGYGRGTSKINVASTTVAGFILPSAATEIDIKDLSITRTGTPGGNAHGIVCTDAVSLCKLNNLYVQGHYDGLHLRTTGYSECSDIITTNNLNNGIYIQNTMGQNAIQWYISRILAQVNGNHGIYAESLNGGGTQVALGDWTDIRSFANSGAGVAVKGYAGAEINALRLRGGFLGEDGLACIYMNSWGFGHKIENMFLEIAGTRTTGPTLTTPATGTAPGIQIQATELDVKVADCFISGNSASGINSNVTTLLRVDCTTFKANTGYGVIIADGAKYAETGCDFISNTTGARSFTANSQSALIVGSTPATTSPTQFPGGVAVGTPTGGTPTAGLINVSAGLLKNNTAYTNP